jgi:hypothetical protein
VVIFNVDMFITFHMVDPGVDGRIILKCIFRKCDVGGMDWIELA